MERSLSSVILPSFRLTWAGARFEEAGSSPSPPAPTIVAIEATVTAATETATAEAAAAEAAAGAAAGAARRGAAAGAAPRRTRRCAGAAPDRGPE